MELRVIGCHGGETPKHRTSAFLVNDRLSLDAGSLTSGLELKMQCKLEACLISHAHLDHIRDLATIADNRVQNGCPPLVIAATKGTIRILKKHFFNNLLWPDFSVIPAPEKPTIRYLELTPEKPTMVAGHRVRAIMVDHTIEACAFIVDGPYGSIAYSGDTGPTYRLWELLNQEKDLRALLMEVSFPNKEQRVATISGHHTPKTLGIEMKKYRAPKDLPTLLYHIKPSFQGLVERECAKLRGVNLTVCRLGDHFLL
ncbi:MAG TPA: 3',5'-cyclic-nucleotide phosphodiesterase [Polyangiaceae bacterium]|nr:3',5'-cyclic-nucleotide phosphodiesterase [Polyangiaceae bacterium]